MKLNKEFIRLQKKDRLYECDRPIIGLTGGIATGKSTVSKLLSEQGFLVVCADNLIKEIYQTRETFDFIKNGFPEVISDGRIFFSKLRELAFNDFAIKSKLENFLYPKLEELFLQKVQGQPKDEVIVYDVPLLFENKLHEKVDLSVVVYADRKLQLQRALRRDEASTEEVINGIIDSQMDIEVKKGLADFVINNLGDTKELKALVADLVKTISNN